MRFLTIRWLLLLITLISSLLLGSALLIQYFWDPYLSAFCLAQKLLLGMFIVLGGLGSICGFQRFSGVAMTLLGLVGVQLSLEQLYFQRIPGGVMPGCLPPLGYLVDVMPLTELVLTVFSITGECAGIHPEVAGISIPIWFLGLFIIVSLSGFRIALGTTKIPENLVWQMASIREKKHNEPQNK